MDIPDSQAVITNPIYSPLSDMASHLVDNDMNTCVPLHLLLRNTVKLAAAHTQSSTLSVHVSHSLPQSESGVNRNFLVLVHKSPPLHLGSRGLFQECSVTGESTSNSRTTVEYQCICEYGSCESVLIRAKTLVSSGDICDVSIEPW